MKNNTTIISLGDKRDFDSFLKFHKQKKYIAECGFRYRALKIEDVLSGKAPVIKTDRAIVFVFFPFDYWDTFIEHKRYRGMYGNLGFYKKFIKYGEKVFERLQEKMIAREIIFINDPRKASFYRDKAVVSDVLTKKGVLVPKKVRSRNAGYIERMLNKRKRFYVKVRCGSMGKGITYLERDEWSTNFGFNGNKIFNMRSDYGWQFRDITGNRKFLEQLLVKDIIIEEAVDPLRVKGWVVDFRVYAFFDKVLYVYPRKNKPESVTTNISQGGQGSPGIRKFLSKSAIRKIEQQALLTMKATGLNFAGIDIMLDKHQNKAYVVDVNMFPGFPKIKTYDLARSMVRELRKGAI